MARGDPLLSPWTWQALDYLGRGIYITVPFNETTRAVQSATVARDTGCLYHRIYIDVPDSGRDKRLPAPDDGEGPRTYTKQQMNNQGLDVIEDILVLQITAGP